MMSVDAAAARPGRRKPRLPGEREAGAFATRLLLTQAASREQEPAERQR